MEAKDRCSKLKQTLEEEEKASRALRWELEDRRQLAEADVSQGAGGGGYSFQPLS